MTSAHRCKLEGGGSISKSAVSRSPGSCYVAVNMTTVIMICGWPASQLTFGEVVKTLVLSIKF